MPLRLAALPLIATLPAAGSTVDRGRPGQTGRPGRLAAACRSTRQGGIQEDSDLCLPNCSRARGVTDSDLAPWNAKFGNPTVFVSLVEPSDRIITE
jgi:hypothetical protein